MTVLNITLTHICAGGNHLTIDANVDGGATKTLVADLNNIVSNVSEEEMQTFTEILIKLYAKGKTKAQAKSGLQSGLVVNL